ncbi:hypothetical protein RMATCC62417_12418 [Rhizopus microsporus]|nr:hypothetical protein RMATCC62417_12418 [Rhizopus microsporus]
MYDSSSDEFDADMYDSDVNSAYDMICACIIDDEGEEYELIDEDDEDSKNTNDTSDTFMLPSQQLQELSISNHNEQIEQKEASDTTRVLTDESAEMRLDVKTETNQVINQEIQLKEKKSSENIFVKSESTNRVQRMRPKREVKGKSEEREVRIPHKMTLRKDVSRPKTEIKNDNKIQVIRRRRIKRRRVQTVFDSDDEEGIRIQMERIKKAQKRKWNPKATMNTINRLTDRDIDEIDTDDLVEQTEQLPPLIIPDILKESVIKKKKKLKKKSKNKTRRR